MYWAGTGLITVVFIITGFLLKNSFISFKNELHELKQVMSEILDFISTQREKNNNIVKEISQLWDQIDAINSKQDEFYDTLNKIKISHFRKYGRDYDCE